MYYKTGLYTKSESDTLSNLQQSVLSNITGSGIELLSTNQLRRIFGADGIAVSIYLNVNDANDLKNYNIQISGLALQNHQYSDQFRKC